MHSKKQILVVAPHRDDETLGVGGTIAKFAKNGDIFVLIFRPPSTFIQPP